MLLFVLHRAGQPSHKREVRCETTFRKPPSRRLLIRRPRSCTAQPVVAGVLSTGCRSSVEENRSSAGTTSTARRVALSNTAIVQVPFAAELRGNESLVLFRPTCRPDGGGRSRGPERSLGTQAFVESFVDSVPAWRAPSAGESRVRSRNARWEMPRETATYTYWS